MHATERAYRDRFMQLERRFLREGHAWAWPTFVQWLIARRPALRPASYRQYRAAVVWTLQQSADAEAVRWIQQLRQQGQPGRRHALPPRTSAGKAKSLRGPDLDRLQRALAAPGGRWTALTQDWLYWGMQTGLRPVEWRDVAVNDAGSALVLRVRNAKHSQGRTHGSHRTVHLLLEDAEVQALRAFVQQVQADFDAAYLGCRMTLHRAARRIWPRRHHHPTLYTGRHVFSANAKASGLTPLEIAALMGHAVTDTHQAHYGKRRSGIIGLQVAADPQDVQRVQRRMQGRAPRGEPTLGPSPSV